MLRNSAKKTKQEVWSDLKFDGPSPGLQYGNGRVAKLDTKKKPIIRLDYQPYPGTKGESRLHLDFDSLGIKHVPLDPRRLFDGKTMNHLEIEKLISIMEMSFSGKDRCRIVAEYWKKYDVDFIEHKLLGEAWSEFTHYVTDHDIRIRDPEYDECMRRKLQEYIEKIRKKFLVS